MQAPSPLGVGLLSFSTENLGLNTMAEVGSSFPAPPLGNSFHQRYYRLDCIAQILQVNAGGVGNLRWV